jgi:hypothetical protein
MIFISIKGQANTCSSFPCYNNGSCTPAGASFLCHCKNPYVGNQCQSVNNGTLMNRFCFVLWNIVCYLVNPCSSTPCKYGGTYVENLREEIFEEFCL